MTIFLINLYKTKLTIIVTTKIEMCIFNGRLNRSKYKKIAIIVKTKAKKSYNKAIVLPFCNSKILLRIKIHQMLKREKIILVKMVAIRKGIIAKLLNKIQIIILIKPHIDVRLRLKIIAMEILIVFPLDSIQI